MNQYDFDRGSSPMLDDYSGVEKRGRGIDPVLALQIGFWVFISAIILWRVCGY